MTRRSGAPRRSRRRLRSSVAVLAAIGAGVPLALVVSIQPVAGQGLPSATVPPALLADLAHMDSRLAKLKRDWEAGKIGGDSVSGAHGAFTSRVREIEGLKRSLVKDYFDGPTYGSVMFSEVFNKLD